MTEYYAVEKKFVFGGKKYSPGSTASDEDLPDVIVERLKSEKAITPIERQGNEVELKIEGEEDDWSKLERIVGEGTSTLPEKWNPERDNPPEPGYSIFGTVKRTGEGPYGSFLVVERKDGEQRTIWQQTALSELMSVAVKGDKVGVKFTGLETNPRGQQYVNYICGCLSGDGKVKLG